MLTLDFMWKMKYISLLLAVFFLISCQPNYNIKNSHYCVDTLSIQPQKMTESLGVSDYSVDSIVRLKLSGNVFLSNADKMIFLKNRIFILDKFQSKKIWVFDGAGSFLYTIGEVGKSLSEFIEGPSDFDVDESEGKLYAYDKWKGEMLIFSDKGKFLENKKIEDILPTSFAIEKNGNFVFSIKDMSMGRANYELSVYSPSMQPVCNLKALKEESLYLPANYQFSKNNGHVYYIPILSDSVFRIANDTIDKLIWVDFDKQFISAKDRSDLFAMKHPSNGNHVKQINDYQESDNWVSVSYVYKGIVYSYIKNKKSGKIINTPVLIDGLFSPQRVILHGDQLICFLPDDFNSSLLYIRSKMKEAWKKQYALINIKIQHMIDSQMSNPAIVYLHLK